VLIPAFVVLSLGAGIGYAAWTQLDSGRRDANMEILDSTPLYPGAREIQRVTQTSSGEDAVPIPDEIVTSALIAPPADATEADIVAYYVESLEPEWKALTRVVSASEADEEGDTPTSFRVDFTRGDDCLSLLTYGMAEGHVGEPTYALSAQAGGAPCPAPE
jgi:hypothetical protein